MTSLQLRFGLLILSLLSAVFVGYSLYLEHYQNLSSCVLCLMQRYCMASIALLAFVASRSIARKAWLTVMVLTIAFASLGLYFSGRQLWLQSLPADSAPACMPSLETLINYFPWQAVIEAIFMGTGDCAHQQYQLFGLSLPAWGAIYFTAVIIFSCFFIVMGLKKGVK